MKKIIPVGAATLPLVVLLVASVLATSTSTNIEVNAEVEEAISLEIVPNSDTEVTTSGNYLKFDLKTDDFQIKTVDLRATTNDSSGLTLTASSVKTATTSAFLKHTIAGTSAYIYALSSTGGSTKSSFPLRTVSSKARASWGVAPEGGTTFAALGLGTTASPANTIATSSAAGELTNAFQVAIRTAEDSLAGTYTGSILFTAVGNYQPITVNYFSTTTQSTFTTKTGETVSYSSDGFQGVRSNTSEVYLYKDEELVYVSGSTAFLSIEETDYRYERIQEFTIAREDKATYTIDSTLTNLYDSTDHQTYTNNVGRVLLGWTTNATKADAISNRLCLDESGNQLTDDNDVALAYGSASCAYTDSSFNTNNTSDMLSGDYIADINAIDANHKLNLYAVWGGYAIATLGANGNMDFAVATSLDSAGGFTLSSDSDITCTHNSETSKTCALGDQMTDNLGSTTLVYTYYVPPVMFGNDDYIPGYAALYSRSINQNKTDTTTTQYQDRLYLEKSFIWRTVQYQSNTDYYISQLYAGVNIYTSSPRNTRTSYIPVGITAKSDGKYISSANFDASFSSYRPLSTVQWFGYTGSITQDEYNKNNGTDNKISKDNTVTTTYDSTSLISAGAFTRDSLFTDSFSNSDYFQVVSLSLTADDETTYNTFIGRFQSGLSYRHIWTNATQTSVTQSTWGTPTSQNNTNNTNTKYIQYLAKYHGINMSTYTKLDYHGTTAILGEDEGTTTDGVTTYTYPYLRTKNANGTYTYYEPNLASDATYLKNDHISPTVIEKSTAPTVHTARDTALSDHDLYGWTNMGSNKMTSITNFKNLNTDYVIAISGMFACYGWEVEEPFTLDLTDFHPNRIGVEKSIIGVFANAGAYSSNFQITGLSLSVSEYQNIPDTEGRFYMNQDQKYAVSELSLIENFAGTAYKSSNSVIDLGNVEFTLTTAGHYLLNPTISGRYLESGTSSNLNTSKSCFSTYSSGYYWRISACPTVTPTLNDFYRNSVYENSTETLSGLLTLDGNFMNSGFKNITLAHFTRSSSDLSYLFDVTREFYGAEKLTTIYKTGDWAVADDVTVRVNDSSISNKVLSDEGNYASGTYSATTQSIWNTTYTKISLKNATSTLSATETFTSLSDATGYSESTNYNSHYPSGYIVGNSYSALYVITAKNQTSTDATTDSETNTTTDPYDVVEKLSNFAGADTLLRAYTGNSSYTSTALSASNVEDLTNYPNDTTLVWKASTNSGTYWSWTYGSSFNWLDTTYLENTNSNYSQYQNPLGTASAAQNLLLNLYLKTYPYAYTYNLTADSNSDGTPDNEFLYMNCSGIFTCLSN